MQDKHLFEYAVIRIVPMVEREEFLNAGVVLYCRDLRFLRVRWMIDQCRLEAFAPTLDIPAIEAYLRAFEQVCEGGRNGGPIGQLPLAERFRWLTATRSTVVQTSKVHPGFCITSPEQTLEKLYHQLVAPPSGLPQK